ncbi:MAG TPA: ParB N-terminal domain-containing protein [Chitinophagaceae bacterium]|nr:ParB N-terminal domain-containing protein [Chitinophagaceae bacterium]
MIQTVNISTIRPNPDNPRLIKDDKFQKLVKSIKEFPEMLQLRPIVVNDDMVILGGNMRLKACKEAGMKEVPIIKASDLTPEQQKEFIIKDNVGFGEWDWDMIANEWDTEQVQEWGVDLPGFDFNDGTDDFSLNDGDKPPFQQMTFTLADAQAELIKNAMKDVEVKDGTQFGNENSNGNALHQIVLEWAELKK